MFIPSGKNRPSLPSWQIVDYVQDGRIFTKTGLEVRLVSPEVRVNVGDYVLVHEAKILKIEHNIRPFMPPIEALPLGCVFKWELNEYVFLVSGSYFLDEDGNPLTPFNFGTADKKEYSNMIMFKLDTSKYDMLTPKFVNMRGVYIQSYMSGSIIAATASNSYRHKNGITVIEDSFPVTKDIDLYGEWNFITSPQFTSMSYWWGYVFGRDWEGLQAARRPFGGVYASSGKFLGMYVFEGSVFTFFSVFPMIGNQSLQTRSITCDNERVGNDFVPYSLTVSGYEPLYEGQPVCLFCSGRNNFTKTSDKIDTWCEEIFADHIFGTFPNKFYLFYIHDDEINKEEYIEDTQIDAGNYTKYTPLATIGNKQMVYRKLVSINIDEEVFTYPSGCQSPCNVIREVDLVMYGEFQHSLYLGNVLLDSAIAVPMNIHHIRTDYCQYTYEGNCVCTGWSPGKETLAYSEWSLQQEIWGDGYDLDLVSHDTKNGDETYIAIWSKTQNHVDPNIEGLWLWTKTDWYLKGTGITTKHLCSRTVYPGEPYADAHRRINSATCQVNDDNILYFYIIEKPVFYPSGLENPTGAWIWEKVSCTFGVVNRKTGYSREYELDDTDLVPSSFTYTTDEQNMLTLMNGQRETPLVLNPMLTEYARKYSKEMWCSGEVKHSDITKDESIIKQIGIFGENVGLDVSVSALFAAIMASPEHYANMVNEAFINVGIGFWVDTDGNYWMTQVFSANKPRLDQVFTVGYMKILEKITPSVI